MATALHIHANLVWRAGSPESRIKRFAALRLLTEPHYRLPLEDLSKALASSLGSAVAPELLMPAHLAEVFDTDPCFSHSGATGNVLIDAAALLGAGKACLKEFIDRRWDAASPLSWARRQLAWYIVSRQQIDTQAADLFWAPVDDAESFLAAAWTARMELRDNPGPPYKSLEQLLSGEPLLEVLPDQRVIKLVFSALVNPACASPLSPAGSGTATNIMAADNTMNGSKHETRTQIAAAPSREDSRAPAQQPGNIKRRYLDGNWADMVEVASASDGSGVGTNCGSGAGGGEDASWVAELSSGLRRTHLSQPPLAPPLTSSQKGPTGVRARSSQISHHVTNGTGDGQDADTPYVDDLAYEYTYDGYDNLGDDDAAMHDDHDGDDPAADPDLGKGYGPDRSYMTAPQSAAPVAPHALTTGTGPANPPWPLRPELLPVYVRAVFSGRGLTDQLMVSVALTLVDAGRGGQGGQRGGGQGQGQPGASAGYAPYEPQRFRLPLSRLLAQVRETAPHLLQALGVAEAQGSGGGGGGVEALRQRLMERPSRGCFRLVPMGAGAGEGAEREEKGGGGGGQENSGEEAVVLDLSVLREWVVEVLTTASQTVFAGPRKVDLIRRTAAMHLATRTRSFGGRAHCVRLTVLARILAESLPDHVDPNRLTGFARMMNAEFTGNVLHVFKRVLASPAGQGQDRGGGGVEEGTTCVTLNVGRLLSTAASGGISGSGGGEYGGGSTVGAAATRAGGAGGGGTPTGQSGWPQRIPSDANSAPSGHTTAVGGGAVSSPSSLSYSGPGRSSHGGGAGEPAASLPPSAASPPTEVALTAAVAALFPAPLPTSRQAPVLAAKRTAALALVKALHSQPGGLLPMGRLMDIVNTHVPGALPGAQSLENLLAADPDVFEMQEHWPNGPCGVRLRAAGVMARAARLPSSARAAVGPGAGDAARGSGYFTPTVSAVTAPPAGPPAPTPAPSTAPAAAAGPEGGLPQRPGVQNCPYYMKHGTCGYGANCKYNHPALTTAHHHTAPQQEQPAKSPTAAAAAAATVLAAAATAATSTAHNRSGGAGPPPSSSQQQPPPHPSQQQSWQPGYYHPPATEAVPHERPIHAPPPSSGPAPPSPPTAASTPLLPTSAPTSAPAPAPGSPLTIEVKVVTGVCTPDHLDMLQHCFAAGQVAIGCKVAASYHSDGGGASGASTPCLVQLFANAAGSASASQQQQPQQPQGSGVSGAGRPAGSAAGGSGGGGGGEPRWPATVYLVDPTGARGDKGGLLLASLSALLEDPAVSKVIYCGAEVVPYLVRSCGAARIAPLHDISVLHAMLTAASGVVPTVGDGPGGPSTPPPPPATTPLLSLGSLLQQHGVMTPAGAAAVSVAPPHSQLWTARPLSPELRQQAVLEVVHLGALWAGLMGRLTALPQQLSQTAADRLVRSPSPTSIQIHAQNPNHPAPSNSPPPNPSQPHGHMYTHPQGHQTHSHGIPHLRTATHAEATAAILQSLRSPPAAAGASRVVPPAGHGGREPQSYGPSPPPRGLVGVQRWHPGM